jgi:MerR family mercuric resistance operon transcriptional regulator
MGEKQFEDLCLTIGALSRRTAVNVETIRYYERIGLLPRPPRTRGGHRTFGSDSCRALIFIKRSRQLGFALNDIRALLSLRDSRGSCMDVRVIAQRHLEDVRAKMRDLVKLEGVLADAVARCTDNESTDCPVLESLATECCVIASPPQVAADGASAVASCSNVTLANAAGRPRTGAGRFHRASRIGSR